MHIETAIRRQFPALISEESDQKQRQRSRRVEVLSAYEQNHGAGPVPADKSGDCEQRRQL